MPCKPSEVSYSLNGGAGGPVSKTYAHLSSVPLTPAPTRVGYTFQGWATSNGGAVVYNTSTTKFIMPNTAVNLYAIWKANTNTKYTVQHYQMNTSGSYPSSPNATQNLTGTSDTSLTLANLKQSYTGLTYSYGTADGTRVTTSTIAPNGSRVIRLYYTRNKYRFTLGSHAGVTTSGSTGTTDVYYGATVTLKGTLNTGYTGNITWKSSNTGLVANKTTSSGSATTFAMPLGAVSMTPSANKITYTISYNANGGSGAPGNQTKTYGVNLTLSSTKPTRSGYTFQYWTASTGGNYSPGGTYTANSACTMTASWMAICGVTYHSGHFSNSLICGWCGASNEITSSNWSYTAEDAQRCRCGSKMTEGYVWGCKNYTCGKGHSKHQTEAYRCTSCGLYKIWAMGAFNSSGSLDGGWIY